MTKKSILCCAFICILLPAFTQEFSTPYIQTPENDGTTASAENAGTAVLVEQDSPAVVKGENTAEVIKDEKKFGITPVLMLSAWANREFPYKYSKAKQKYLYRLQFLCRIKPVSE